MTVTSRDRQNEQDTTVPGRRLRDRAGSFGIVFVAAALFITFSVTSENFLTVTNLLNILQQVSVIGVIAVGMTVLLILGGIDLSVGSTALLGATVAGLFTTYGWPDALGIAMAVAAGATVGLANGLLIEKAGIDPLIATLGSLIAARGVAQMLLLLEDSWIWVNEGLLAAIGTGSVLGIPYTTAVMAIVYAIAALLLLRTATGRRIYAIGGGAVAAHRAGIAVTRIRIMAYVLSGLLAGLGGVLVAARVGVVSPPIGLGMEFVVITAVILGGASIAGGSGRVERTFLGVLIIGMVLNYMTIRGIAASWQSAVTGLTILAATVLDHWLRRTTEGVT